ncbi:MAG: hypothetical protein J6L91_06570 [Clostridia bacterium]|nr:hypothetical protein [Clostridia bacterium]
MKKLISVLLVLGVLFSFSSCKIGEDKKREETLEEAKEVASKFEETNTRKDPKVIENLSKEQKQYFDSLGSSEQGTKLVVYTDSPNFTLVYSCEFKDNRVSKVMSYHIIKNDNYFNAVRAGIDSRSPATVDEKNKIIKADKTEKYKSKTYDEMTKEFAQYSFVEE